MGSDLTLEPHEVSEASVFPKLSIVIPALNEAESIGQVLDEIAKVFDGRDHSVVIVDGNSTDGTPEIAGKYGAIVINQRGTGYGDALLSGFVYARDELAPSLIAMMDADMTYDPKDIPVLMEPIVTGDADLVVGRTVTTVDMEGNVIGEGTVVAFRISPIDKRRTLISIEVPEAEAFDVAGFVVQESEGGWPGVGIAETVPDDRDLPSVTKVRLLRVRVTRFVTPEPSPTGEHPCPSYAQR